jgi:hypothetical protein
MEGRVRELVLFNLGIDSKLRACDLVALKVRDVSHGDQVANCATAGDLQKLPLNLPTDVHSST